MQTISATQSDSTTEPISYQHFQQEIDKLLSIEKLKEIANIVLPNTTFDFTTLKSEIEKLKNENLSYQIQIREDELRELITGAKNKLGKELEFLLEILPKIQVDIVKKGSMPFAEERFRDLATILEKKISREEIELICQKKREIVYLEEIIQSNQTELENNEKKLKAQIEVQTFIKE
jgi:hypothetical protein